MWRKFSSFILRQRVPILIALGLITIFMLYRAKDVEMVYEMYSILPKEDTTFQEFALFHDRFGTESSVLVLGMEGDEMVGLKNFQIWYDFCEEVKKIEGVDKVVALPTVGNLKKNTAEKKLEMVRLFPNKPTTQSAVDSSMAVFKTLPFYLDRIYLEKDKIYVTALTLDRRKIDSKERKGLMDKINVQCADFQEKTGIEIHYSGLPYIRANNTTKIAKEVQLFIVLAVLITTLIMFLFFRSLRSTLFSMMVVLIGVIWAIGWMGILGYNVTMLTGLIPPLIIVIGIPNCIFLLNNYHQEYKNHGNQIKALSRVIAKIGNAIFLTNFTTSLGIAAFIITKSRMLVEFGVVTSISIMSVFILSITLIPIIFSFSRPPRERHTKHLENKWMGAVIEKMVFIVLNKRKWVYGVTLLLLAISVYGITLIKTTGNISDDLPKNDIVFTDLMYFEKHFNGVIPFEIMIETKKKGTALQVKNLKKVEALQNEMANYELLSKPLSIVDGIKFSRQAFYNGSERRYALFTNQDKSFLAPYLKGNSQNSKTLNSFVDSTKSITRIAAQIKDVGTEEMRGLMNSFRPVVDSIFDPALYNVVITGTSVVFLEGTKYLVKNLFTSLILAILVISMLMAALFYSARMVLMSLIPNLLPLIVTAAAMGYFNIPLKPSTILIFSIAFGISIDDTIHYLAKFRQELKSQKISLKMAILEALRETGFSMIYTSVVLFFGFGVFAASDFGGTVALGMLVSFTLLVAMNANLILLPSLLLSFDRLITTKAFEHEALLQLLDEEEDIEIDELEIKKEEKKQ